MRRTLAPTATLEPAKPLGPATLSPRKAVGLAARGACAAGRCRKRECQPVGSGRRGAKMRRPWTPRRGAGGCCGAGGPQRADTAARSARRPPI
jgi:hypothetical protein